VKSWATFWAMFGGHWAVFSRKKKHLVAQVPKEVFFFKNKTGTAAADKTSFSFMRLVSFFKNNGELKMNFVSANLSLHILIHLKVFELPRSGLA
jgi:hypothetical protein